MNECIPVGNIACGKDVLGVVDSARQDDDEDEAVVPDLVAAELAELQQYGVQVHGPGHRSGWSHERTTLVCQRQRVCASGERHWRQVSRGHCLGQQVAESLHSRDAIAAAYQHIESNNLLPRRHHRT